MPVNCIHRNGYISGYRLRYRLQSNVAYTIINVVKSAINEVTISGLTQFTTYDIEVAAVNSIGIGMYSKTSPATTKGYY